MANVPAGAVRIALRGHDLRRAFPRTLLPNVHYMKVVILAGGLGTRLAEETEVKPKPMVEIGGRPILWHIMKHYAAFTASRSSVIALGYKGDVIKRYFLDYCTSQRQHDRRPSRRARSTSATSEMRRLDRPPRRHRTETHDRRPRQAARAAGWTTETFMVTYGDGVCNVDLARAAGVPSCARTHRDGHGRPAAGALRRA